MYTLTKTVQFGIPCLLSSNSNHAVTSNPYTIKYIVHVLADVIMVLSVQLYSLV